MYQKLEHFQSTVWKCHMMKPMRRRSEIKRVCFKALSKGYSSKTGELDTCQSFLCRIPQPLQ